jgi:hypothetical protein
MEGPSTVWKLMVAALEHIPHMDIEGTQISQDKNVRNKIEGMVASIRSDPRYGQEDFQPKNIKGQTVEIGDGPGDPLTWMVRHGNMRGTNISVTEERAITMRLEVNDTFNFVPAWGSEKRSGIQGFFYNLITEVTGDVWHGLLGASEDMTTTATWTETIYPDERDEESDKER